MSDSNKTKKELLDELVQLRKQIAEFNLIETAQLQYAENLIQHSAVPTFVLDMLERITPGRPSTPRSARFWRILF